MSLSYADRAKRYAKAVAAQKIPAGKLVQSACKRHLDDLAKSKDKSYPYKFDPAKAKRICEFAENMVHVKGEWARPKKLGELPLIRLEDWQCFLLSVAFGWVRKSDGLRRFRELYWEIPRKNSKSTIGAIIGLYMAFADDEVGAEVFSGATSMEQAYAVFRMAWRMVQKNPEFKAHFGLEVGGTDANPGPIYQLSTGSRFAPIIGKPGDGDSPSCAIVDEYHEHTTPALYDAMKTGMGARSQPMLVIITTAGSDTSGPCYDKHLSAEKVLDGTLENDHLFTAIFGIDQDDSWTDFGNWKKANPNFGVSVYEDNLRAMLRDAEQSPSEQNIKQTKHLNRWMNAGVGWMNMVIWERQKDLSLNLEDFRGQQCWLGADLASKIDIASLAYIFKRGNEIIWFCKHYLPKDTIELPHNAHYRKWRDEGWLIQTDGARTDLRRIENDIREASAFFSVQELAFDQKEANYLITNVQEWASFTCVDVPQGPALMSEPMKEMEAAIYGGSLRHQGDPVLTWMMGNVVKKEGRGGGPLKYYYPTKQRDQNKIDGVVAGIMALGRAMVAVDDAGGIVWRGGTNSLEWRGAPSLT